MKEIDYPPKPNDTLSHSTYYIYIAMAMKFSPLNFQETLPLQKSINEERFNNKFNTI